MRRKRSSSKKPVCPPTTTSAFLSSHHDSALMLAQNLDTSREFYPKVITTRSYDERLATIDNVRKAGISVCSGGILGLGEKPKDRVELIWEMSQLPEPPESFPVNALVPIEGTPLADQQVRRRSLSCCVAQSKRSASPFTTC